MSSDQHVLTSDSTYGCGTKSTSYTPNESQVRRDAPTAARLGREQPRVRR